MVVTPLTCDIQNRGLPSLGGRPYLMYNPTQTCVEQRDGTSSPNNAASRSRNRIPCDTACPSTSVAWLFRYSRPSFPAESNPRQFLVCTQNNPPGPTTTWSRSQFSTSFIPLNTCHSSSNPCNSHATNASPCAPRMNLIRVLAIAWIGLSSSRIAHNPAIPETNINGTTM